MTELVVSEDDCDVAYLYLKGHPGPGTPGCVTRQRRLSDLVENYRGPDIYLDFDAHGALIGIEILA